MFNRYLLLLLCLLSLVSCHDDNGEEQTENLLPVITWDEVSARFRIYKGETLTLVPKIAQTDETTTYQWTLGGQTVSRSSSFSFQATELGEFYIKLCVTNRYGATEDEAKVTVLQRQGDDHPEIPVNDSIFAWKFPGTEINVVEGRTLKVKAYRLENAEGVAFSWTLDGTPVTGLSDEVAYVFSANQQGLHTLTLTAKSDTAEQSQDFMINVCPPCGTYRRSTTGQAMVNKIYEYQPAPSHQVNGYIIVGESYPAGCTHSQACDSVLAHFSRKWMISLGSQGGYVVAGFDHSVLNSGGDYDLCIKGNPFSYQSEPGIIWVSQDDNGDGLPNDQWFELAGSEYGTVNHSLEYAITYYKPETKNSAVPWRDNEGATGYVPYLSYWNPADYYWQDWQQGREMTFFGSRLADQSTYENGYSDIPAYSWGYADNLGEDFIDGPSGKMGYYRLSNARTWDGRPANLEYIDFVKVQTAQIGSTPNLGDISTEIYYIGAL